MLQYHAIDGPGGADKRSRMSLENEDHALDAAIAASLQETAPPDGCIDEDSSRVRRQRSESTPHTAYSDSLRVAQEMEFLQGLEQDQEKEAVRYIAFVCTSMPCLKLHFSRACEGHLRSRYVISSSLYCGS